VGWTRNQLHSFCTRVEAWDVFQRHYDEKGGSLLDRLIRKATIGSALKALMQHRVLLIES
jgi:hypothetical protein